MRADDVTVTLTRDERAFTVDALCRRAAFLETAPCPSPVLASARVSHVVHLRTVVRKLDEAAT